MDNAENVIRNAGMSESEGGIVDVGTARAKITLKTLTFSDGTEISLNADDIVVLVGPNNSGKSVSLKEIETHLSQSARPTHVVTSVEMEKVGDVPAVRELVEKNSHKIYINGAAYYSGNGFQIQV